TGCAPGMTPTASRPWSPSSAPPGPEVVPSRPGPWYPRAGRGRPASSAVGALDVVEGVDRVGDCRVGDVRPGHAVRTRWIGKEREHPETVVVVEPQRQVLEEPGPVAVIAH